MYSDKYLLDTISEEFVQRKCQNYLTPQVFMEGQKGVAKLCTSHITQTPDKKVLLKCTDTSRKKFKYIDEHGNIKEDHDARAFIEKVFPPIKKVTDIVYSTMMGDIEEEQENTEEDDYDRKSQLREKLFRVMDCYAKIINIDNPNQNSEFKTELAILNK
jgi:predicted  nucleic acid-binding Zn-ribbon protein